MSKPHKNEFFSFFFFSYFYNFEILIIINNQYFEDREIGIIKAQTSQIGRKDAFWAHFTEQKSSYFLENQQTCLPRKEKTDLLCLRQKNFYFITNNHFVFHSIFNWVIIIAKYRAHPLALIQQPQCRESACRLRKQFPCFFYR